MSSMNRRHFLAATGALFAATAASGEESPANAPAPAATRYQNGVSPWPITLNSSTIRTTPFMDKIRIARETGWDGIEPWINELEEYEAGGGDLIELGKTISGMGLAVPNIIGLWDSMPSDEAEYKKSLEVSRNRMRMAAAIGSTHIAAIPTPDRQDFDITRGTDQYRELLRIGREEHNITVAVEFVGFLQGVHRLGQACAMAIDTDDSNACVIADTFHLFRGGSGFNGLKLIDGSLLAHFHWNDVPGDVPREKQGDEHRLFPGDGVLPLADVLRTLKTINYKGMLSLEIFREEYWKQDPKDVAARGRDKMLACIQSAGV